MTQFKIEFPADRTDIALAVASMLQTIGSGETAPALASRIVPGADDEETGGVADLKGSMFPDGGEAEEETEATGGIGDDIDDHDTLFDKKMCGLAKEPFYKSGPRKGQWKKQKSVAMEDYDAWYGTAPKGKPAAKPTEKAETAGAFTKDKDAGKKGPSIPQTFNELILWVSEQQANEDLDQDDVNEAYETCEVTVADLIKAKEGHSVFTAIFSILNSKMVA